MKKGICAVSLTMAAMLGMTACGNVIPDMTDAQMQAVGEYAAVTLMKYDVDHRSRLVDLELVAQEDERRAEALRREQEAAASQEETGMRPTEDTPVIGADGLPEGGASISMEEVLNLPEGVTMTYRDMVVCDSYPEENDGYFSMSASNGNRFVVLKFDLYNGSGQDQLIDILSQGVAFNIVVNGNYTRRALTTMLTDDITCYKDTVAAGSSVELVAVMEAESSVADSVSALGVTLRSDTKTHTAQFF